MGTNQNFIFSTCSSETTTMIVARSINLWGSGGQLWGYGVINASVSAQNNSRVVVRSPIASNQLKGTHSLLLNGDLTLSNGSKTLVWVTDQGLGDLKVKNAALDGILQIWQLQGLASVNLSVSLISWDSRTGGLFDILSLSYLNTSYLDPCQDCTAYLSVGGTQNCKSKSGGGGNKPAGGAPSSILSGPYCSVCPDPTSPDSRNPCSARQDCPSLWCETATNLCTSCWDDSFVYPETALDCGGVFCRAEDQLCCDKQACVINGDCISQSCQQSGGSLKCDGCTVPIALREAEELFERVVTRAPTCNTVKLTGTSSGGLGTIVFPTSVTANGGGFIYTYTNPYPPSSGCTSYTGSGLSALFGSSLSCTAYCLYGWSNYPTCNVPVCEPVASNLALPVTDSCNTQGDCVFYVAPPTDVPPQCNCFQNSTVGWRGTACDVQICPEASAVIWQQVRQVIV